MVKDGGKHGNKNFKPMNNEQPFRSNHNLSFEVAPWIMGDFTRFRIGTCHGLWRATDDCYQILAIDNEVKGNGHLIDVFEWFENSCKRDKKNLMVLELWNNDFAKYLIRVKGFEQFNEDYNIIKYFTKM